ncbi:MAG TPA: sulfatase-like hydrolase/transferase [Dehalococcoidia bacterium]|nr:sulfatase-like hydrolase/transferase [Dehalococcoidia bacterium]
MKQKLRAIFKGPVVFYPLLFAVFPILFLYVHNISETSASQIWLPLVISVAATLVLWAVLSRILGSLAKAGFATAIFLVFFFSYGRLYDVLERVGDFVPRHAYLLAGMLFVWGCCVYFIGRAKRDFRITTRLFNITAVVLITINLFNIVSYQVRLAGLGDVTPAETSETTADNATELNTLPDTYFIILDEYARPDTMKEYYDYDNSEFIDSLEDKGFFIANGSETRTPLTPLIIAQILNMDYLDYEPWSDATYRKIAYSQVANFLKAQGYQYIVFGNNFATYTWEKYVKDNVDFYLGYYGYNSSSRVTEFVHILWNTTMLRPFYYQLFGIQYEHSYRSQTLYMLEKLKALPELEGPKFVFAHFICPHEPFVFGPEGEYIAPANWDNHEDKQFYLGQYIFISGEIEKVIDVLLEKSETPPIIILQSDHGLRPGYPVGNDEWHKIFNAMYLPGMDTEMLYDNIAPVNTFRLIFNQYFGADYPLLEDD